MIADIAKCIYTAKCVYIAITLILTLLVGLCVFSLVRIVAKYCLLRIYCVYVSLKLSNGAMRIVAKYCLLRMYCVYGYVFRALTRGHAKLQTALLRMRINCHYLAKWRVVLLRMRTIANDYTIVL